jgi:hypothetical protein
LLRSPFLDIEDDIIEYALAKRRRVVIRQVYVTLPLAMI